jgi:hypothetical protein
MISLRAGLDTLEKKNISCFCQESNHDPAVFQAIAKCYTDDTILAPWLNGVRKTEILV